jgi:hypothetical protein
MDTAGRAIAGGITTDIMTIMAGGVMAVDTMTDTAMAVGNPLYHHRRKTTLAAP